MLWIALGFVVAMMIGFLVPRKPLKLDLGPKPGGQGLPPPGAKKPDDGPT